MADAAERAALRAMDAALSGEEPRPFHELVREEQRKMLRVVPHGESSVPRTVRSIGPRAG
jgi:hypothetical protein